MNINREEFFREVTMRICSSLDIRVAFKRCFEYMKQYIRIDSMFLSIHDEQYQAIRCIACEPENIRQNLDEIIPLPADVWDWVRSHRGPVIADSGAVPLVSKINELIKISSPSTLAVPLRIEGNKVGVLVLKADVPDCYTGEHAELMNFIPDPFAIALSNALAHQELLSYRDRLLDENMFLQKELTSQSLYDIIGAETGLKDVMEKVRQVAPHNNTVLLLGETGVGKEAIANAIHYNSSRSGGPFIKVNCGAIPESLIDSELFGHEKGAFTGAVGIKRGRFERSDGGTIFLDEIGELPMQAQIRLLRVLQNHELERVGGTSSLHVDIRVIAATHRNLYEMVLSNAFREDLWFRLNVFPIYIPPLRYRKDDIPELTKYLVRVKSREMGLSIAPQIAPSAIAKLKNYGWPGNVRELQNAVERELISLKGDTLTFDTLFTENADGKRQTWDTGTDDFNPVTLEQFTAEYIRRMLRYTDGRINGEKGAARLLGMNPSTLRSRMEKLGIERTDYKNG